MWWRWLAEVQTEHQNGEETGFKWLWMWNGLWCQRGWSEYLKNCWWSTGISRATISRVYREWSEKEKISTEWQLSGWKCLVDVRGQRRMGRLVRVDRKATVTQITTRYNQGIQNTISEHTTCRTLKQMGYSSRGPHRVPLLSAKNRKRRLQFTQAHLNWTIEDCKNVAWSDESRFLLRSILPCINGSGWWWWCNGVGDIFFAHFGPYSTNWASSLPAYCCWPCHPFMTTVYPSSDDYFQHDNAPCHKAQIISDWFLEHDNEFTLLKCPPQSPDLNKIEHFGMWWNWRFALWMCSRQICSNCAMLSCQYGPKSLRNVSNTLLNLCHKELRQLWRQKGSNPALARCT